MNDARRLDLQRKAMSRPKTSAQLLTKVRAIDAMFKQNIPGPVDVILIELQSVVENRLGTYEADRAAGIAGRLIDQITGDTDEVWPSETPDMPAGDSYWPHDARPSRWGMEPWRQLDSGIFDGWERTATGRRPRLRQATQGDRDAHRRKLEGPPPWRKDAGLGEQTVPVEVDELVVEDELVD